MDESSIPSRLRTTDWTAASRLEKKKKRPPNKPQATNGAAVGRVLEGSSDRLNYDTTLSILHWTQWANHRKLMGLCYPREFLMGQAHSGCSVEMSLPFLPCRCRDWKSLDALFGSIIF